MSDEIKVTVVSYGAGRNLMMVYFDPITGKKVARTSGTRNQTKAIGAAAVWQDELNSGRYQAPSKLTWAEFRKRHTEERLSAMPEATQTAYRVALDHLQRIIDPDRLGKLTSQVLSRFQAEARKQGMRATTIARHLRHIKASLRWAERQGMLAKAPAIEMPKLAKGQSLAKHRPVTSEELDRMVATVPKVRADDAPAWQRLLRGLWLSGLRLGEALILDWDSGPFVLDVTGTHPAFRIEAEGQKSRRSEIVPTTPDFIEWLMAETPEAKRVGCVFKLAGPDGNQLSVHTVGPMVSAIGRKAGVVVGQTEKMVMEDGKRTTKAVKLFAGAHDLRRGFCSRWARKVTAAVLMRLARHSHISTTMAYYVSLSADDIGADLWANHWSTAGNTSGNTGPKTRKQKGPASRRKSLS